MSVENRVDRDYTMKLHRRKRVFGYISITITENIRSFSSCKKYFPLK